MNTFAINTVKIILDLTIIILLNYETYKSVIELSILTSYLADQVYTQNVTKNRINSFDQLRTLSMMTMIYFVRLRNPTMSASHLTLDRLMLLAPVDRARQILFKLGL